MKRLGGSEPDESTLPDHDEAVAGFLSEISVPAGERHPDSGRLAVLVLYRGLDIKAVQITPIRVEDIEEGAIFFRDGRGLDPKMPVDNV